VTGDRNYPEFLEMLFSHNFEVNGF